MTHASSYWWAPPHRGTTTATLHYKILNFSFTYCDGSFAVHFIYRRFIQFHTPCCSSRPLNWKTERPLQLCVATIHWLPAKWWTNLYWNVFIKTFVNAECTSQEQDDQSITQHVREINSSDHTRHAQHQFPLTHSMHVPGRGGGFSANQLNSDSVTMLENHYLWLSSDML